MTAHGQMLRATYREERFDFTRTLDLHAAELAVSYELESEGDLPWMWSQHRLLAARPGERIALKSFSDFKNGREGLDWFRFKDRDLSLVGPPGDGFALKVYANAHGLVRAAVEGAEGGIAFAWDSDQIAALGLWLDWGGWPADSALGAPVHHLAIEPTTAPADELNGAERLEAIRRIRAGESSSRCMTITLTDPV